MVIKRRRVKRIMIVTVNDMLTSIFPLFFLCSPLLCSARDNITWNSSISDLQREKLVSAGETFELGFFTPDGALDNRRYVGIWYYRLNPRTVVWVANRESPLLDSNGIFAIAEDGKIKVLDRNNKTYWSSEVRNLPSIRTRRTLRLLDSGNLVLMEEDRTINLEVPVWQSFENPSDTFLPGMKMGTNLVLTSWASSDDPRPGKFTFEQDPEGENQYIIRKEGSIRYWQSNVSGGFIDSIDDEMLPAIFTTENITGKRLVMDHSGKIRYYALENAPSLVLDQQEAWSLYWWQPRNRCSVYNACGSFGICNSRTGLLCKCLPGFQAKFPGKWNSGDVVDFSEGCTRINSSTCDKTFLNLTMMKVGKPKESFPVHDETECANKCLNNCNCQAYSYANRMTRAYTSPGTCHTWEDLNNLWENFTGGRDLHVRVAASDIGLRKSACKTCGTNLIPYPLSTDGNCGDPLYYSFNCSKDTGKLRFNTPNGTYHVTRINPKNLTFAIQVQDALNCSDSDSVGKVLLPNPSSPFFMISGCNEGSNFSSGPSFEDSLIKEIEIGWKPPSEPMCSSSKDCTDWPSTSCSVSGDGHKKCLCEASYGWNRYTLNCTLVSGSSGPHEGSSQKKNPLYLLFLGIIATVIVISCVTCSVYYLKRRKLADRQDNRGSNQENIALHLYDTERRVKDLIDTVEFREDDKSSIDVPFFDLASILAATDNFSDSNKLGQGGFGPVYKGKFPGGQEIAIKRLSRGSGQGLEEFKNEVVLIAKLQHRNLVRLLGYCVDRDEKMLLYEYMPNKSLDSFLFDRTVCVLLNWEIRFTIILGIARGMLYLHQDSRLRIIHRDLKTSNVLLDEEMNPKISDLHWQGYLEANKLREAQPGGYMSPEYALDGFFSVKSDVFSFGVVVLEVISGKRNTGFFQSEQALSLLGYAWKLWKEDRALDLMDQTLRESCNTHEVSRCVNVGLLCVQEDPSDRPTMSNAVFMLGSEAATLPIPKQPAYVIRRPLSSTASSSSKPERFNELTGSLEEGR